MTAYNLFRNASRPELLCAVSEHHPVPAFIRGPPWEYGGRIEAQEVCGIRFSAEAAEASIRYNGFYLFQAMTGPQRVVRGGC